MRTYRIDELSPEAKKAAIEGIQNRSRFTERDIDLDWLVSSLEADIEEDFSLENVEISFTGFYNQGDGASFTGRVNNIPAFIRAIGIEDEILPKVLESLEEIYEMRVVRINSRYSHENTVRFEIEEIDDTELIIMSGFGIGDITIDLNETLEEIGLEKKASEWVKVKSREIYRTLRKAYEEEFGEEVAVEWADNVGLRFDEEGNEI